MKKFKKFIYIPIMALLFGVLPSYEIFSSELSITDIIHSYNSYIGSYTSEQYSLFQDVSLLLYEQEKSKLIDENVFIQFDYIQGDTLSLTAYTCDNINLFPDTLHKQFLIGTTYKRFSAKYSISNKKFTSIDSLTGNTVTQNGSKTIGMIRFFRIRKYTVNGVVGDGNFDYEDTLRPTEKPTDGEYIWISSPKENTKLSGYIGQNNIGNYKIFDIEVYGRYLSKNGLFDTVGGIRTSIINSTKLVYADGVKLMGEGLGLKSFEWIVEPKNGEYAEYRMVFYAPMLKIGTYDLTLSQTVKSYDGSKNTLTDTIKGIEFLIDNYDDNIDSLPPSGGSSGEVDGDINNPFPSDKPDRPDSLNILDWLIYILDTIVYYVNSIVSAISTVISILVNSLMTLTSELMSAVGKFTQIFGMLPEPMPQLITLSATVLCFTTVINLIRR